MNCNTYKTHVYKLYHTPRVLVTTMNIHMNSYRRQFIRGLNDNSLCNTYLQVCHPRCLPWQRPDLGVASGMQKGRRNKNVRALGQASAPRAGLQLPVVRGDKRMG